MELLGTIHVAISGLSGCLSLIGNIFVITVIAKFSYLRTKANVFVIALAVSDMLIHIFSFPRLVLSGELKDNATDTQYNSWLIGCRASLVTNIIAYYSEFQCVAAIAIDRFLYIKYPFSYDEYMNKKTIYFIIAWIVAFSTGIAFLFIFASDIRVNICGLYTFIRPIFFYSIEIPYFTILVLIMVYTFYTYFAIATKTHPEGSSQITTEKWKDGMKITRMMLLVVGVFLVTNAQWYIIFFATYNLEGSTVVVIIQSIGDWIWLVS